MTTNEQPLIVVDKVTKLYERSETPALHNVSLTVRRGELLVLLGSSGSGKSTLLKMINRLIVPTRGDIFIGDINISQKEIISLRRSIGYVFQSIGLFPHMTVEENVSIVPRLCGHSLAQQQLCARQMLELVHLDPDLILHRYPDELSGGQQQRVGVARALAGDPLCLLMDEPFSALDAITRESLQQEILELKRKFKKSIVFVTHDLFEALALADRIAILHEGHLHQIGTPQKIINNPASEFIKTLFEKPKKQLTQFISQ